MKKVLAILVMGAMVAGFVSLRAAENVPPQGDSIGITSTMILPAVRPGTTNLWGTNVAYTVGDYVYEYTNNMSRWFWCVSAGTSTNAGYPVFSHTNDTVEGGVTWRYVTPRRKEVYLINDGSGSAVYLGFGEPAEINKGIRLNSGGGSFSRFNFGVWQGEIFGISVAATNVVCVQQLR